MSDRIRIRSVETLSDQWTKLTRTVLDYQRRDGIWTSQTREIYEHGDAATVLPYDPARGTVLLVRQFRLPVYMTSGADGLLEACAGLLDGDEPETCIRREAEEEMGCRLHDLKRLYTTYTSPGSVTERVIFFTARYSPGDRIAEGGGKADEGEDIEIVEMTLDDASAATRDGRIIDAKTIMLVQELMLVRNGLSSAN